MQKNFTLGVVTGLVVAVAVAALGWLFFRARPTPRRTPADAFVAGPAADGGRERLPPLPDLRAPRPAPPARAPSPAGATATAAIDYAALIYEILSEYDGLIYERPTGSPELDRIRTLRERSARIDALVERLAALGPDAVPALLEALRADSRVSRVDRQTLVVRALAKIPGKEAIAALGEALTTSEAWGVKMTVVAQLAENGGADGLALLASRLELESDFRVRGAMLKFLGQKKSPEGVAAAERLAQVDPNPNVRIAALRALGEGGDPAARFVLEERARLDQDIAVRQNAIQVYGRIMKESGLPLIEDLLQNDPNLRIKAVAILALQEMGGDGARRTLERYANDPAASEDVRARASGALAAMDRQQRGGAPSVGAKLDAIDAPRLDRVKPIAPIGGTGR